MTENKELKGWEGGQWQEKKNKLLLHVRILFLLLYHSSLTLFKYQATSDKHIRVLLIAQILNKTSNPARVIFSASLSLIRRACSFSLT